MSVINRKFFYDQVRATLFAGRLTQKQVDGLNFILDTWEDTQPEKDDRWLAYALGTVFHETAFTMQPIHEFGGETYFFKMYDPESPDPKRAALARKMGNTEPGDGVRFHGRGLVQLTWRDNYKRMGLELGRDFITNGAASADLVLEPTTAARIMFVGMEGGLFTGQKFADHFLGDTANWTAARKIINGLDQAQSIGSYGQKFYAAISYTT